jgi:hypothetical protein
MHWVTARVGPFWRYCDAGRMRAQHVSEAIGKGNNEAGDAKDGVQDGGGGGMKAIIWYRAAAVASALFAIGHTVGFLRFRAPNDEGRRVWVEMTAVHFAVDGRIFSYGGFYLGFGLIISVLVLFLAALMWWLGNRSREGMTRLRGITWTIVVVEAVILTLSLRLFGIGPAVLSGMTGISLVAATVSTSTNRARL